MAVSADYKPEVSFQKDGTIWLPLDCWKLIRDQFTKDERAELNGAIVSECLCPQAAILNSYTLGTELTAKLRRVTSPPKAEAGS